MTNTSLDRPAADLSTPTTAVNLLDEGHGSVVCMRPKAPSVRIDGWTRDNAALVDEALRLYGAVLLRDFSDSDAASFKDVITATSHAWADYREPATPRTEVASNIFTSTEYPAERIIPLHNENSHCTSWPLKIYFHCVKAAASGGQTPIADCRGVLARIPKHIVDAFAERKWLYVRHFGSGLGFSWSKVFQTNDKAQVEAYCRDNSMNHEWGKNDTLTVRYVRPAVRRHPSTGEAIWFNHGLFFNPISIEVSLREMLLESFSPEQLPYNTFYGDGGAVDAADLQSIADAFRKETRSFTWKPGDVLIADNMLIAHGRNTFTGSRKILVGMANPHTDLENASTS